MEELREALIKSILTLGRNHKETIRISQALDLEIVKAMKEQHYVN
ncbi:aspartyl-phosphate phosphatase Spo0E family protein [uncultured Clostridium sp.]|nr:aspartyl-phosphate phosphatase Spo0E family protein [uncultured Clostridium sp.]